MSKMRTKIGPGWRTACAAALAISAACAWAQEERLVEGIAAPLYAGNIAPVRDEYGRKMAGTHRPGAPVQSYVELRVTTNGIIRPPSTNGAPHPYHPLLTPDSVGGMGLNASGVDSGLFCMVLPQRPAPNIRVFARVFNAPTPEEATFYADSRAVAATPGDSSLVFEFGAAKALDPGDADGDGLNNSWEESMGTSDRLTADYDGDGMSDLHEMLAGTSATDPGSLLAFRLVRREDADAPAEAGADWAKPVRVSWQSVPGKQYRLEYVPMLTSVTGAPPVFVPVGDIVTAEEGDFEIEMVVNVPADELTGTFRVRLVTDGAAQ